MVLICQQNLYLDLLLYIYNVIDIITYPEVFLNVSFILKHMVGG